MCRRGFTLLETMIALMIVGGLLITLLYTLNYNLAVAARHEAITFSTMLAKNMLNSIEYQDGISAAEKEGAFPEPYSDYRYAIEIKDSIYPSVAEVIITVTNGKEEAILSKLIKKKNGYPR
ncbi:MAG: type II secretion system GspH family protein [Nitrospirae bacterium]|nr:type II secretion system GspH family protein [Nitrospirota bacterium]